MHVEAPYLVLVLLDVVAIQENMCNAMCEDVGFKCVTTYKAFMFTLEYGDLD